ncbi:MAG: aryl-sulfate sulfotransferase [Candidatus Hermodarchaeota archaeon]
MSLKQKAYISLLLFVIISNVSLFLLISNFGMMQHPHDVDRRANGNTLISTLSSTELFLHLLASYSDITVVPNNAEHKIVEVDQNGNILWEFIGLSWPHEIFELPNEHLLVADTGYDRVIEIDYPNKNIVWEWKPELINWTEVNPAWGSDHYFNTKTAFDWTHLNDVDFKQYETWNACLVSIRNFDLIVEINYTAESIGPSNNPANILWWYGDYENHSLIYMQHNPDYLENGNIIIADSTNNRILEINKTSKQVVWSYAEGLKWPRDANVLDNGNVLITDSFNHRIIEVNKDTKEIVWFFKGDLIFPYEADMLENENILFGSADGTVYEINKDGIVIWRYGVSYGKIVIYLNLTTLIITELVNIGVIYKKWKRNNLTHKEKKKRGAFIAIHSVIIIFSIIILITHPALIIIFFNGFLGYL